jgi:hypothetical protein
VEKIVVVMKNYFYWLNLWQDVNKYIRSCTTRTIEKPSIKKQGLYTPFPTRDRPWESISMDHISILPSTKHGNYYVFIVIDRFSKMADLVPCKKSIIVKATDKLFFKCIWVHFGLPQTIILDYDSRFLSTFLSSVRSLMDTKLTKSTSFHPQIDGQMEVVNMMIVHNLRMYNFRYPRTWDESLPYVQHSYNQAIHSSTDHKHFQVCLGFHPLVLIDVSLPIAST